VFLRLYAPIWTLDNRMQDEVVGAANFLTHARGGGNDVDSDIVAGRALDEITAVGGRA
jgi:hypothetical protein